MIIDRKTLIEPMERVVAISGRNKTLPVLDNVLIELGTDASKVTATDLSTTAIARIPYAAGEATTLLVHGDAFCGLLKELDPGDIEISVNGNIEVKQHNARFTVVPRDPREFPEVTTDRGHGTVVCHSLIDAQEDSREDRLRGVCLARCLPAHACRPLRGMRRRRAHRGGNRRYTDGGARGDA